MPYQEEKNVVVTQDKPGKIIQTRITGSLILANERKPRKTMKMMVFQVGNVTVEMILNKDLIITQVNTMMKIGILKIIKQTMAV